MRWAPARRRKKARRWRWRCSKNFVSLRALTIATTHHDRLKSYASTTPGIVNAAMEFDQENLRPTYRLLVGVPGTSSGIEIARRLGLPERVVEYAQASLSPESREARDLIAYLHRSRDEMEEIKRQSREELAQLESERRSLRGEWVDRQKKRIAELERNFQETIKRLEGEVARVTADVHDRVLQAQLEKQSASASRNSRQMREQIPTPPWSRLWRLRRPT